MDYKKIIRKSLHERFSLGSVKQVYSVVNGERFPYDTNPDKVYTPVRIDPKKDYVMDYSSLTSNQDLSEFPTGEFQLGMQIERQKNKISGILDLAEKVIQNLKGDKMFYSKLK